MESAPATTAAEPDAGKVRPLERRARLLWALVALAIAGLSGAAVLVLLRAARGPRPPFLDMAAPAAAAAPARPPKNTDALVLAGSGTNLPLTRVLAEAFRQRTPAARIVVQESIGSAGGIQAVKDGAIDVGLISRPLTGDEERLGLVVTPYARVPIVVAANPTVPDRCTSAGDLVAMYGGAFPRWSDGSRVVVLQRERGDSSFRSVSRLVPGLSAQNDSAYRANRWRVLYDDRAMQEALMSTEGAVGIFDLGAIEVQRLPIKVLCIDGAVPSAAGVAAGSYPYHTDLSFVTAGAPSGAAAELIGFVRSPAGRKLVASGGYVALPIGPAAQDTAGGAP